MKPKRIFTIITIIVGYTIGLCMLVGVFYFLRSAPSSFTWVMDQGKRLDETYLVKMCPDGSRLFDIQFSSSGAIGIDPITGTVWAPMLHNRDRMIEDQIVNIDVDGNIIQSVPGYPSRVIAVDPNDGSVWVGLPNERQLVKLSPSGDVILQVNVDFHSYSIAVDPIDSSVWVAAGQPIRSLVHFDADGVELFRMDTPGFFSSSPYQVAVDPQSGHVWYTGFHSGNVYKISSSGTLLATIDGFDRPVSISIHPSDGGVWVADYSTETQGAVVRLGPNGERIRIVELGSPPRIAIVNPYDETVWVGIDEEVIKMTDEGEILERMTGFTEPDSIAFAQIDASIITRIGHLLTCLGMP